MASLLSTFVVIGLSTSVAVAAPSTKLSQSSPVPRADTSSTFYIVDSDSGALANAPYDLSGVWFGSNWSFPTLFTIDSSTGILLTADPGQTTYDTYIETSNFSPVQIGTAASSGFMKCSIESDQLACSVDGGYTQFMLDEAADGDQLYLVQPGTIHASARSASMGVQYASPEPQATPTKFYLSTSMGYTVNFGADSAIYAGSNYAKEGTGSVYTIDKTTGYLTTSASTSTSESIPASYVAYINNTSPGGYSQVHLTTPSLASDTMSPLTCQIANDQFLTLSCQGDGYQQFWLDRVSSTSGDYVLYMGTEGSSANDAERVDALARVLGCTSCS